MHGIGGKFNREGGKKNDTTAGINSIPTSLGKSQARLVPQSWECSSGSRTSAGIVLTALVVVNARTSLYSGLLSVVPLLKLKDPIKLLCWVVLLPVFPLLYSPSMHFKHKLHFWKERHSLGWLLPVAWNLLVSVWWNKVGKTEGGCLELSIANSLHSV